MKLWYFQIDGEEGGPIGEEALLIWIMQGRLPREALLRSEEGTEWKPAEQVFPGFFPPQKQPPTARPKGRSMVPAPPPEGTGGKTPIKELLASGVGALRAQWPVLAGAYLIYTAILQPLVRIPYAGSAVVFFLTGPLELGWTILAMVVSRGGKGRMGLLLSGFPDWSRAMRAGFLRSLIVGAWALLSILIWGVLYALARVVFGTTGTWDNPVFTVCVFVAAIPAIIPSYIATLRYSLTMFLLGDDRARTATQALRRSKQVMTGRKRKLFALELPFLVLAVLVTVLTNVLGYLAPPGPSRHWVLTVVGPIAAILYVLPITLCTATFYDDLHPLESLGPPWTPQVPTPLVR